MNPHNTESMREHGQPASARWRRADDRTLAQPGPIPALTRWGRVTWAMTTWLTLLWVCVFTSLEPLVILSGIVVAVASQLAFATRYRLDWFIHPLASVVLVAHFLKDLTVAGVQVSWMVISGKPAHTDMVPVRVHCVDPMHLTLLAALLNLVPGTVVVSMRPDQHLITLNVLNMESLGGVVGVRSSVHAQEQRLLNAVTCGRGKTRVQTGTDEHAGGAGWDGADRGGAGAEDIARGSVGGGQS